MTPILDAHRAMSDAQTAFNDMRIFKGTEQYKRVVDWIEAIIVQQQCAMNDCAPDKLPAMQIRLKQLIALRSALLDAGGAFTGFIL